mgnify:CR=1 FL=1
MCFVECKGFCTFVVVVEVEGAMMLVVPTFDASAAHFIVGKPRKYLLTARLVLEQRLFFVGSVPLTTVGRLAGFAVRALGAGTAYGTLPH